jgi:hypothetical protein
MPNRFVAAALMAALLSTAVSAGAQASASVTLSGFRFTLINLDPTDGINPSIRLIGRSSADVLIDANGVGATSHLNSTTFAAPVWATLPSTATNGATAWMLGNPYGPGATAHAEAFNAASPTGLSQASIWFRDPVNDPISTFDFVLSPHTEVLMSGTLDGAVSSDQLHDEATASMFAQFYATTSHGRQQSLVAWDVHTSGLPRGVEYDMHHDIALSFVNPDSTELTGTMNSEVSAVVASSVAEPGAAAMLLAGAVLLAAHRRGKPTRPRVRAPR